MVIALDVPAPMTETPTAVQVAVYTEIAAPPLVAGAVNTMVALALPAVALVIDGAPGTVLTTPVPVPATVEDSLPPLPPPLHALNVTTTQEDKTMLIK